MTTNLALVNVIKHATQRNTKLAWKVRVLLTLVVVIVGCGDSVGLNLVTAFINWIIHCHLRILVNSDLK